MIFLQQIGTSLLSFLVSVVISVGGAFAADSLSWQQIEAQAHGKTVDWYMWGGSPAVNTYVNEYLRTELRERYGIILRQVPVQDIAEVVSKLAVEKQAAKVEGGSVDLMWINGENFRTCKKLDLLSGPLTNILPNSRNLDSDSLALLSDFGTPVENMEVPWGNSQLVMIYDSARTPAPPRTISSLLTWIQNNPGRFTYPAPPDFTGSAFVRQIFYHEAGSVKQWQGNYSKEDLKNAADKTFATLVRLKEALWREGRTYPESPVRMDTLFADKQVDFSFSYQQGSASQNIDDGIFQPTVRTYVFEEGTVSNTHYVAIPFNAKDKYAAMVVANFLLSFEAQLEKAKKDVWGDFPVISLVKADPAWKNQFSSLPKGPATLSDEELQAHQLPEPPAEVLIYLEKGWQKQVLKNR
ncbi:ABC transporter substrate-binding protein [Desulforhopalus sp. IMCC35007]|uniref:ABC transporter substrate-binding protein n=1 Tax=Desulforhopalus sp. IMCC35007 TaxID=2569543 RepID=UPI0010ADE1E5|nr:ABC transporter substrate-binding protein [Desulforhopalus sp. IMCC35007]TKB08634.1 ABC transporter substrate-binding protein [Desulforhopalus sp. IMCC35007]